MQHRLLCLGAVLSRIVATTEYSVLFVEGVNNSDSANGAHLSILATFSTLPPPDWFQTRAPAEPDGCTPWTSVASGSWVAVVRRGTCTFVTKTLNAQRAGASGVVVVTNVDGVMEMGGYGDNATSAQLADENELSIFAVSASKPLGDALLAQPSARISVQIYRNSFDVSEFCLICMATSLVVAGASFATSDMREGSPLAPRREDVVEVDQSSAVGFCIAGSLVLLVLFFFMRYMIYFIIFSFCLGGASCFVELISKCLQYHVPRLRTSCDVPCLGPVSHGEAMACVPSFALVGFFLFFRNTSFGWIFQDIIGAGFLCMIQQTLRLPNIQVATILLSAMFCFDVFWVFISPSLFFTSGKSVMVEVATGGGTGESVPMLLKLPVIGDPLGHERMLGFGDVALPGLLVSYLLRHDLRSHRAGCRGYFLPAVVGYFIGLCVTVAALFIMRMGQPALLYLVPGTLGTTLVLGFCRGEIGELWRGEPTSDRSSSDEECLEMMEDGSN